MITTIILATIALCAAVAVARLRHMALKSYSTPKLWAAAALCIMGPAFLLGAMQAGLVPSTVPNLVLLVVILFYFGVIQGSRIFRQMQVRNLN